MGSRGPGRSASRVRASSYVGPPFLKCATVSRVPPSSRGSHRTAAASHYHARISAAPSMLGVCRRAGGARGIQRSEDTSPRHPVWGSDAAHSHSVVSASHRRSGPAPRITVGRGRECRPHPSKGTAAYCVAGTPGERVPAHHLLHSCAYSASPICASHAVMELRPMIHSGKSAPRMCFEKPPDRSR